MSDYTLSAQQLEVISALSNGASTTAAAEQAGVHRNTVTTWRRNLLPFQRALADAQYDRAMLYREKMEDLVDLAVQAIQQILADPKTPPSIRLKAALAIVALAAKPPEPKKQIELIVEQIEMHKPAQSPEVHNPAQTPIRRDHPRVGRNEPCPCQSGLKYKRCCAGKPHAHAAAAA